MGKQLRIRLEGTRLRIRGACESGFWFCRGERGDLGLRSQDYSMRDGIEMSEDKISVEGGDGGRICRGLFGEVRVEMGQGVPTTQTEWLA